MSEWLPIIEDPFSYEEESYGDESVISIPMKGKSLGPKWMEGCNERIEKNIYFACVNIGSVYVIRDYSTWDYKRIGDSLSEHTIVGEVVEVATEQISGDTNRNIAVLILKNAKFVNSYGEQNEVPDSDEGRVMLDLDEIKQELIQFTTVSS